jgi:hypothetical protein
LIVLSSEGFSHLAIALLASESGLDFTPIDERYAELQSSLREIFETREPALLQIDPEIGWVYGPNYRGDHYSSNQLGLRGRREYADAVPQGVLRLAAFGDSFVHANEVSDDEGWSARLEEHDDRIEALNYGVGGYGTDQALLYFERRGEELSPQVVLLGFADVDFARNVNRYRRFRSARALPLFKPRFLLAGTGQEPLALLPSAFAGAPAMRSLLESPEQVLRSADHDWFFRPLEWKNPLYDHVASVRFAATLLGRAWESRFGPGRLYRSGVMNTDSEAFEILIAIVERFARVAEQRGQHFIFVIFPGNVDDIWGAGMRSYQPLVDRLSDDVRIIDLSDTLRDDPAITLTNLQRPGGHYGPEANLAVAKTIHRKLIDYGWLDGL